MTQLNSNFQISYTYFKSITSILNHLKSIPLAGNSNPDSFGLFLFRSEVHIIRKKYKPGKKCSAREGEMNVRDYMKPDWFTFAVLLFLRVSSVNNVMRGMGIFTLEHVWVLKCK